MTSIDRLDSASNNGPLAGSRSTPGDAADLIHTVTDPNTGAVDTRRLASIVSELGGQDFHAASVDYAQIEAELSQRNPMLGAQFSRDVADAFATRNSGSTLYASNQATPQGLSQLLESKGIKVSASVDYGNIPEEHQWRYDRYLATPSTKPKLGPNEWYAAAQRIWANNAGGNSFEQQVRTELGAPLGRGSKPVSIAGFVPDLPVGGDYGVTDVKNVGYLYNTDQLKAFAQYAKDNNLPFNLIVGPRTQGISEPVLDNVRATNGTVTQYDPDTHQFSQVDVGESGLWKRPSSPSVPENSDPAIRASGNIPEEGGKVPTLEPVSEPTPAVRAGTLWGAGAGTVVSVIQLAATGRLDAQNLEQVAKGTGEGAVIGAVATKAEQFVTPAVDRVIGATVQSGASKLAATAVSQGGADTAGVVVRTLASRVAGATVVGAAITTGISAWENRAGLMHGDSKAIGNVVADTTVAAGSIAAATAAGAAIGSVVPVAGTAVGAVVGLAVGLGITYGAQISGLRNAIADGAAHVVDGIKSAASGVADVAKSVGSGVSHAASSVAHFFGF